jgi:arsenite methyltransferase
MGAGTVSDSEADRIRDAVRRKYGAVPQSASPGCGCSSPSCCTESGVATRDDVLVSVGYSVEDLSLVPHGANLGLGCGNPLAIASLKAGQIVLDLGSGGGFDCFLAAQAVGERGRVIGVDMTPEMLSKARELAAGNGFENVEFRLGEIENLPAADCSVDVIISNCVINRSPEKQRVFQEAFRVLKPGGRLVVSDVVVTAELPNALRSDPDLYSACIAGAPLVDDVEAMLAEAGFMDVQIRLTDGSRRFIREWAPGTGVEDFVVAAIIEAAKPM